jgi:GcrA cell cycle regulator
MSWTEERTDLLRRLWPDVSASQIAKQLGGVTRNAVIGKAHRLGLAKKAEPPRPSPLGRSMDVSRAVHPLDRRR